jgi:hypothetical protein
VRRLSDNKIRENGPKAPNQVNVWLINIVNHALMTRIRIIGELSRRRRIGIGRLRWSRWSVTKFDQAFAIGEVIRPLPRFEVEAVSSREGILIRGSLKGIRCDFGEIVNGKESAPLSAPSVGGVVLNGRAEIL